MTILETKQSYRTFPQIQLILPPKIGYIRGSSDIPLLSLGLMLLYGVSTPQPRPGWSPDTPDRVITVTGLV